jgi:hypothetical protein
MDGLVEVLLLMVHLVVVLCIKDGQVVDLYLVVVLQAFLVVALGLLLVLLVHLDRLDLFEIRFLLVVLSLVGLYLLFENFSLLFLFKLLV